MINRIFFRFILFCIFNAFTFPLAYSEKLDIGAPDFPPFSFRNEQGKVVGVEADLVREVFADLGDEVVYHSLPWNRIFKEIKYGEIVGSLSVDPVSTNEPYFNFSDAISTSVGYFYKRKSDKIPPFKDISELKGKKIAIIDNYSIDDRTKKGLEDKIFSKVVKVIAQLPEYDVMVKISTKQVDIGEFDNVVAQWLIKKHKPKFDELDYIDTILYGGVYTYTLGLAKNLKNQKEIFAKFNKKLAEYYKSGKRDEIAARYGIVLPKEEKK